MKIELHDMALICFRAKKAFVHPVSYDVILKIGKKNPVFEFDKTTCSYNL